LEEELPFLATETIIMQGVIRGGSRQVLHEAVRENAVAAAREIKEQGSVNRLLEKLARDDRIPFDLEQLTEIAFVSDFSGRAASQVEEYLRDHVQPVLDENRGSAATKGDLRV